MTDNIFSTVQDIPCALCSSKLHCSRLNGLSWNFCGRGSVYLRDFHDHVLWTNQLCV